MCLRPVHLTSQFDSNQYLRPGRSISYLDIRPPRNPQASKLSARSVHFQPFPDSLRKDTARHGCQRPRKPALPKTLPCLSRRSAVKLLEETTCGCQQSHPTQAQKSRRAWGRRSRRSSLPAPRATSLRAAVPARRRGARSLARSPLALPLTPSFSLLPPPPVAWLPHGAPE